MLSHNGRRTKHQHLTRNGQLCSRSYTTQPRHILASQTENTRTGSTPTTRSYRLLQSVANTTATYIEACRLLQKHTHALKSDWWERKAVELQRAADRNDMKGFYNGLKEVLGPKKKGPVQLKSTDGMETFSDSKRVVARWSEHFHG